MTEICKITNAVLQISTAITLKKNETPKALRADHRLRTAIPKQSRSCQKACGLSFIIKEKLSGLHRTAEKCSRAISVSEAPINLEQDFLGIAVGRSH